MFDWGNQVFDLGITGATAGKDQSSTSETKELIR